MPDLINKSEKLASALYLITSFFDDREPIKWKLRSLSSELVSTSMAVKDGLFRGQEAATLKVRNIVSEILSMLTVTKNAGLVSDTNYSLIQQEFNKYLDLSSLPEGMSEEQGSISFSSTFFQTEVPEATRLPQVEAPILKDKNDNIDKGQSTSSAIIRNIPEPQGQTSLKEFGAVSVKKNSRQSIIISVLKRKKEIMIKDVSPLISGCSEKTIQRELSAMVQAGILKKIGEKRWSRYTLA